MRERDIFIEALQKADPVERSAYLIAVCAGDNRLQQRVLQLLAEHEKNESFFLDASVPPPARPAICETMDQPVTERPGTCVGPYKLIEQIGEGGMGTVWMAQQTEPVKRVVALKLIKAGMDSKQVLARFDAERQALALMDHPNIARVLDAGTTDAGRPYFVMDLVKGVPITKYCDEHHFTPRQRLELFVPVCQAVQHAHQKGIIHRDLKPSNVLVALYDGKPVPKVIDFGVAKAAGQSLTDKTLVTGFGAIVGTLEYMSPEQAEINQLDIDTRSDIYSLGVLLYELLTGSPPFTRKELEKAGMLEILRVIREQELSKPSAKLSTAKGLPTLAANRGTEPAKLTKLIRGELDWIVMKALEKDRNRRYETANGFAMDLQRYLADEPVQAGPPSARYRLRKFAIRNKIALLTAGLIASVLVSATAVSTWQALRAARAERGTTRQLADAYLQQARATRLSREVGQRFDSLDVLTKAISSFRSLGELDQHLLDVRNEAIACLALPDLKTSEEWDVDPQWGIPMGFDPKLEHYVVRDHQPGVQDYVNQGHLSVRRLADHEEVARLPGFGIQVVMAAFSPDGKFVAAHYELGQRHNYVWDVSRREAIIKLPFCGGPCPIFSLDSRLVAIVQKDNSIRLYDLPSGQPSEKVLRPGLTIQAVVFHPDGHKLAVASGGTVQIHDIDEGKEIARFHTPSSARIYDLTWRNDGKLLATPCYNGEVFLWDLADLRQPRRVLKGHQGAVIGATFSHAGDLLFTRSWDGSIRLWNPVSGHQVFSRVPNHAYQLSQDDRFLAYGSTGAKFWFSELAAGRECRTFLGHHGDYNDGYWHAAMSPDGRLLASVAPDGLRLWDPFAFRASDRLLAYVPLKKCGSVSFFPDGSLLTAGSDGLLRWPLTVEADSTHLVLGPARALGAVPPFPVLGAAVSADGTTVAVATRRGQALVLGTDQQGRKVSLLDKALSYVAVSADGRWVATSTWFGGTGVKVWNARTGELAHDLPVKGSAWATFSRDGKWLMTTAGEQRLWSWKIDSWVPGLSFPAPGAVGLLPVFSQDSSVVAVPHSRNLVRLIDLASGREFASLPTTGGPCCFSPDGGQLVTGGENFALQVWDLRLIRQQLADLGLDWHLPSYPRAPAVDARKPLRVRVETGDR